MRAASAVAGIACRVECKADAIAIAPWLASQCGDLSGGNNAAALQRFTQDGLLECELRIVVCVLIVAAATCAKVWAGGMQSVPVRR